MHSSQKVAVITGAAQGIGRRTAELFAEQGYSLALVDLKPMAATALVAQKCGADVLELTGDISNEQSVSQFAASVRDRWGRADVLVNNAGISFISPAEKVSAADFRRVLEVNLVAPFLLAKAFGALMLSRRSGSIVNVASISGKEGNPNLIPYSVAKAGVIALSKALAKEVLADVSNDLPELERFFFDKLAPLERSGAELVKLHQLSVRQNHSDPVVQIMEPFSDLRLIHRPLI